MSLSIQTNVDSLIAQENLNVNSQFQSKTIQQLTSGYRINSAGDDAAGLAVANQYRDQTAELTQGVLNANDGISQLQIMDGGLDNISTMLDRLQTLATESASSTFTGNRSTLNNEYQSLLSEIDRQADNIGLGANNASNATNLGVYIGGGQNANTNSAVNVDLTNSGVDSNALGIGQTNVLTNGAVAIGAAFTNAGVTTASSAAAATAVLAGNTAGFTFYTAATNGTSVANGGTGTGVLPTTITITGKAGDTLTSQINELNADLQTNGLSISASLNQQGQLQFQSANAFSVTGIASNAASLVGTTAEMANNQGLYNISYTGAAGAGGNDIQITVGNTNVQATLAAGLAAGTPAQVQTNVNTINAALKAAGVTTVTAVADQTAAGTISFQGSTAFSIADDSAATGTFTTAANTGTATAATVSANPQIAIDAITSALASLGQTQGKIGAGENTLNYAINLAQSQITNYSSAGSQIRDANVAQEAANLTKAQVLQQTSVAAMAQANAEPQAILKLLQ